MIDAELYFATAREREAIRRKRLAGEPPPWTDNYILRTWRFTNVHRENDKTTAWFRENVRGPLNDRIDPSSPEQYKPVVKAVESTIIFRWFNRIETGEKIKDLLLGEWDSEEARRRLKNEHPVVTGAYMIHSPYGFTKLDGLLFAIDRLRPLLPKLTQFWGLSQELAWRQLCMLPNMGSFSAGEVIWDLRWTHVLDRATDINTWTIAGPGCAKGLGYVVDGNPLKWNYNSPRDQVSMLKTMQELLAMSKDPEYWPLDWEPWELHEVEMWACEFCKFKNAQKGERLKRRF